MTQIVPLSDTFTEEATHLGDVHSGYARLIAWTTDASSGDSNVCAAGNLHNGYFQSNGVVPAGTSGRFAVAQHASAGVSDLLSFVWRPYYAVRAKARLAIRWRRISGAVTSADFRRAAVGVRLQSHSTYVNTAGSESVSGGDGYWLVARNVATQPGAKFYLLRVNAGVVTKLTESTVVDIADWRLWKGMWISLLISNSGGNPVLRCRRSPTPLESVDGTSEVDCFTAGDYTDTSGSKITAAGRCGFALARPPVGSAVVADWFEITDPNTSELVLRDEWIRANYLVGALTSADANGKVGRNLQPTFSGDVGGLGISRIARDSGANRAKNDATNTGVSGAWAYRASHEAVQRRSIKITGTTPGGRTDTLQLDVRGKDLHTPTGVTARGYELEIECVGTGPVFTARLIYFALGFRTTLATKVLAITVGTHTFDLAVENVGGATPFDGIPYLTVRVDTVAVTSWTLPGVAGIAQTSAGSVTDSRSAAILRGWEQAFRHVVGGTVANSVFLDDWTDSATLPETPEPDRPNAAVSDELDGLTDTLDVPLSWPVEVVYTPRAIRHEYDSDHAQTIATASRDRRIWRVQAKATNRTDRDELLAFYVAHKGGEIPFSWVIDGETVSVVFLTTDLADKLRDRGSGGGIYSYEFELGERLP